MAHSLPIKPRWGRHHRQLPGSAWQRLLVCMMAPAPTATAPTFDRLPPARSEFVAALADTPHETAVALRLRLQQVQCLRELWQARSDVVQAVGLRHGEAEAQQRLERLERHYLAVSTHSWRVAQ